MCSTFFSGMNEEGCTVIYRHLLRSNISDTIISVCASVTATDQKNVQRVVNVMGAWNLCCVGDISIIYITYDFLMFNLLVYGLILTSLKFLQFIRRNRFRVTHSLSQSRNTSVTSFKLPSISTFVGFLFFSLFFHRTRPITSNKSDTIEMLQ